MCRLVAELVGCPVAGFHGQPGNPEIAVEGRDRESRFRVFKAHNPFAQLAGDVPFDRIVCIVRDVRDVRNLGYVVIQS